MNLNSTPHAAPHQPKRPRPKKNGCCLPPADGGPGIKLPSAKFERMVSIGREAAELYLDGNTSLPEYWERLRGLTPPQHLHDIEAGFMGRLEQRLYAYQGRGHLPNVEMREALAVGNSAMKVLHEAVADLSRLVEAGAVVPNNGAGAAQLRKLAGLAASITLVAPVEAGAFR